ncbi:hypothetical protein Q5752_001073 [Cryptotrichosporon argae]
MSAASSASAAAHSLYILLDSNLPTGGFVASSGLESFAKHGFLLAPSCSPYAASSSSLSSAARPAWSTAGPSSGPALAPAMMGAALMAFAEAEICNFHGTTSYYLARAHGCMAGHLRGGGASAQATITNLQRLDAAHEATLLSHVSRRASRTQGIAILTLHARGLSWPPGFDGAGADAGAGAGGDDEGGGQDAADADGAARAKEVVDGYKRLIRLGKAEGHLAVCWGVMTAALGLDLATATHIYLFTHARSLLSAAVRLNLIGPYLSTQLLAHPMRRVIDRICCAAEPDERDRQTGDDAFGGAKSAAGHVDDIWAWTAEAESGPATTWPLGEILVSRHDLQHSRIFNS